MKKKILGLFLLVACAFAFTACDDDDDSLDGRSLTYNYYYVEDFETLNYLTSQKTHDSDFYANFIDGLIENDRFGKETTALAESYEFEELENGNTQYTFTLRDTVWVERDGSVYADLSADDFVSAARYILEPRNASQTISMWFQFIVGAEEWYNASFITENYTETDSGEDFNKALAEAGFATYQEAKAIIDKGFDEVVGVKNDNGKVVYTVIGVQPYFTSVLSYSSFFPVNGEFLQQMGTSFGETIDDILYIGGYVFESYVAQSSAVLKANPSYWDAEHVYTTKINLQYSQLLETSTTRLLYEAGQIDGFVVSQNDADGYQKYVTGPDGTGTVENPYDSNTFVGQAVGTSVYTALWNFDRKGSGAVSTSNASNMFMYTTHTEDSYANTQKAIANADFRKSFVYGIDWKTYLEERYTGEVSGLTYQSKGWTMPGLCAGDKGDYINYFAEVFAENNTDIDITAEEAAIQLYNTATEDVIFNAEVAKKYATAAYNTLSAQGVTFPVKVETYGSNGATAHGIIVELCENIEEILTITVDGKEVQLVDFYVYEPASDYEFQVCYYYGNYDFSFSSGWGPDYADPLTFLNCWTYGGDMADGLGVQSDYLKSILATYTEMIDEANKLTDTEKRYEAFAEAEYYLIYDQAIIIPFLNASAESVRVSKVLPYTSLRASSGLSDAKYKYMIVGVSTLNQEQFETLRTAFRTSDSATLDAAIASVLKELAEQAK